MIYLTELGYTSGSSIIYRSPDPPTKLGRVFSITSDSIVLPEMGFTSMYDNGTYYILEPPYNMLVLEGQEFIIGILDNEYIVRGIYLWNARVKINKSHPRTVVFMNQEEKLLYPVGHPFEFYGIVAASYQNYSSVPRWTVIKAVRPQIDNVKCEIKC